MISYFLQILKFGKNFNLVGIYGKLGFFSGILSLFFEFSWYDHENFFLCGWDHKTIWKAKIMRFWSFFAKWSSIEIKKSRLCPFFWKTGFFFGLLKNGREKAQNHENSFFKKLKDGASKVKFQQSRAISGRFRYFFESSK